MIISLLLLFQSLLFCNVLALVDYTESEEEAPLNRTFKAKEIPSFKERSASRKAFQTMLGYRQINIKTDRNISTMDFLDVSGHFQSHYNIYLDLSYWTANARSRKLFDDKRGFQKGNPTGLVGINWFETGPVDQRASMDILLGGTLGEKNSSLAFSRNDTSFGIKTVKYFGPVSLKITYTHTKTGRPKRQEEMDIGPLQSIQGTLYWKRPRTSFSLESGAHRIRAVGEDIHPLRLTKKISFAYLGSHMTFHLGDRIQLKLGAVFKTRGSTDHSLLSAKLYNVKGSYGNSLFIGLGTLL